MEELRIALVQTPLFWEDPGANREMIGKKLRNQAGHADLIILPEMFTTGFTMSPENIPEGEEIRTMEWLSRQAKAFDAGIMGSMVFSENGKYYNRLFLLGPDGVLARYNKRHTFTLAGEHRKYTAGEEKVICVFRGFRICPLICYDLRFPVWSRNSEDYDALIYVANWPAPRIEAWDTLLRARAIENMAYCIGVNRVGSDPNGNNYPGHSASYDCLGKSMAFSIKEEVLYVTLSKNQLIQNRQKLQFLNDRDAFTFQL